MQDEQSYLIEVVKQWLATPVPIHAIPFVQVQTREPIRRALAGLLSILSEIQVPQDIAQEICYKMTDLHEADIPAFGLIAGLVKAMPNRLEELALTMRMGLVAENVDLAQGAVVGLFHWLTTLAPPISLDSRLAATTGSRERGCFDVSQAWGVESDRRS